MTCKDYADISDLLQYRSVEPLPRNIFKMAEWDAINTVRIPFPPRQIRLNSVEWLLNQAEAPDTGE